MLSTGQKFDNAVLFARAKQAAHEADPGDPTNNYAIAIGHAVITELHPQNQTLQDAEWQTLQNILNAPLSQAPVHTNPATSFTSTSRPSTNMLSTPQKYVDGVRSYSAKKTAYEADPGDPTKLAAYRSASNDILALNRLLTVEHSEQQAAEILWNMSNVEFSQAPVYTDPTTGRRYQMDAQGNSRWLD